MIVTEHTKYSDFEQYESVLTENSVRELKACAERFYKPCHTLTIDEFWGCVNKDFELLGDLQNPTVLQIYWLKRFADFAQEFTKSCEMLNAGASDLENMQSGCVKLSPQESMLTFVREYFGLGSFEAAGMRTVGEYILARKDTYNKYKVRKNYEAAQLRKIKSKK